MSAEKQGQPPELRREWADMANRLGRIVGGPLAGRQVAVAPEYVPAAQVLMFHFGRSFRTFTALGLLLGEGYTQDALVLARTLLEVLFEMAFVARYPGDAPYFLEHGVAVESQFLETCLAYAPNRPRVMSEVEDPVAGRPSLPPTRALGHGAWHPKYKSVRSRAVASGIPQIYYDLFYSLASRYSHGSGDWLREIARREPGGIHVSYTADKLEAELVVLMACDTFLQILIVANAALRLELGEVLREAQEDFTSLSGRTWDTVFAEPRPPSPT